MASDRKSLSCSRNGSQRLRAKGATDWATLMAAQLEPHSFLLGSDSKHLDLRHLNFVLTAFPWTLPQQQCYLRLYLPSVFIYVVKPSNCQVIKYPKTIKKTITEGYENMKDVEIILWTPRFWDLNARKLLWCKEEDHEVEGWNHWLSAADQQSFIPCSHGRRVWVTDRFCSRGLCRRPSSSMLIPLPSPRVLEFLTGSSVSGGGMWKEKKSRRPWKVFRDKT